MRARGLRVPALGSGLWTGWGGETARPPHLLTCSCLRGAGLILQYTPLGTWGRAGATPQREPTLRRKVAKGAGRRAGVERGEARALTRHGAALAGLPSGAAWGSVLRVSLPTAAAAGHGVKAGRGALGRCGPSSRSGPEAVDGGDRDPAPGGCSSSPAWSRLWLWQRRGAEPSQGSRKPQGSEWGGRRGLPAAAGGAQCEDHPFPEDRAKAFTAVV